MKSKYKVQEIIKWWQKYNNKNIVIQSDNKIFNIKIDENAIAHLLGIQYINKDSQKYKGKDLLLYITKHNLSDGVIYQKISQNNPYFIGKTKNRIKYFKSFMENLENSNIVEMTNKNSNIKSQYLIFSKKDNKVMLLGIKNVGGYEDFFETFLVQESDKYFENTLINEKIKCIKQYDTRGNLIPFTFKNIYNIKDVDIINDLQKENINKQINVVLNQSNINFNLEL